MIKSFASKQTKKIWENTSPKGFPADLFRRAVVKLDQIDSAQTLDDMRIPPSNRLELLGDDRAGYHSIRINQQWRITFTWSEGHAHEVKIEDYH
jgi:proteic killer suppression protein